MVCFLLQEDGSIIGKAISNFKEKREKNKCDICGAKKKDLHRIDKFILCYKHYNQYKKYGFFLDNIMRTPNDRNKITIKGDKAYINLYNKKNICIAKAIIDSEDVEKVKYIKWRLNKNGYVCNSSKHSKTIFLHRLIMNTDQYVDHIHHNPLDNRKSELRVVTKSQNQMNSLFSSGNLQYRGVSKTKQGLYYAYIKINQKMINLGKYEFFEEASYARLYAETLIFKEYRQEREMPIILESRKKEIEKYIMEKVQRL